MLAKTHIAFGILFGILALSFYSPNNIWAYFVLVVLGVLLPDIDHPNSKINNTVKFTRVVPLFFKHRGFFHSIFPALAILILFKLFSTMDYGVALFVGYFAHLFSDGMTVSGVNLLHPIGKLHLKGFIKTGSLAENIVFIIVVVLSIWLIIL